MSRARKLDPEWTVPCPTCGVAAGEPCRSKHAIRLHQSRREALRQLERQANRLLRKGSPAHAAREMRLRAEAARQVRESRESRRFV